MGLAQAKVKQRFGLDPNNKAWTDDSSAIGRKLLEKMGWTEGVGLGTDEKGRVENIKVKVKENFYGIGADAKTTDNWLENTFGFDDLLKGMQAPLSKEASLSDDSTIFIMPESTEQTEPRVLSSRHSHRTKFIRNKQVSNYDVSQVNNILGKKSDGVKQAFLKPAVHPVVSQTLGIADYFAQKMAAKGISLNDGLLITVKETNTAERIIDHVTETEKSKKRSLDIIDPISQKEKKSKSKKSKKN